MCVLDTNLMLASSAAALLLLIAIFVAKAFPRHGRYKFPPSPPGRLPIIGHSHLFPKEFTGHKAKEWGCEMMHLRFGGTNWVFLNSSRAVEDLLEKRSSIYSSRPVFAMVGEVISRGKRPVLQPYGERWRKVRKVMHQLLTGKTADSYKHMQLEESQLMLSEMLQAPEKWHLHAIRFAASCLRPVVIWRARLLGKSELFDRVSDAQDEFLRNNIPGQWLVDSYPQLRLIPKFLQWWRPYGDRVFRYTRDAFKAYYDLMQENMRKGIQRPCFATGLYDDETEDDDVFDFDQKLFATGGLIEAGSDTTKNQLNMVIAAMAADPNTWVAKARKELDAVCGHKAERLPTFDDWDKLPYMQAIMKESMRWRPNVNPTGFPHALIRDDEYRGYRLPAGTIVTINNWAISLNPNEYRDPDKFDPDRFLDKDLWNPLKGHYGYGAGRRACAGYRVASNSMFIFLSRFIYCFDVEEDPAYPIDTYHIPLTPPPGKVNEPPFIAKVAVRSEAHRQLILRECADPVEGN
ncbi:cytochrome P450 [Coniochaeta ligniaria NRRL 30616]|uniref:Cytochrome P450 n=1 Tax=Coniochaeta ligniaria NRRL 30616 TaxID=1408157 RepID=A0A1J7K4Q5_9PEZI|nr:cytochrome P450 [Coniochaeta ligniaria NRRL 30616]